MTATEWDGCTSCLFATENTGAPHPNIYRSLCAMQEHGGAWYADAEPDLGFSWTACDVCGAQAGGNRYRLLQIL